MPVEVRSSEGLGAWWRDADARVLTPTEVLGAKGRFASFMRFSVPKRLSSEQASAVGLTFRT